MNFIIKNKYSLLYFAILILSGLFIFPVWSVMITVWACLYFFIILKKYEQVLNSSELKFWKYVVFLYPLIETLIKAAIEFNIVPYSWRPLNILEHLAWSTCMFLILMPFTKKLIAKNGKILGLSIIFGFVIVIGNLNELLEFALRIFWNLDSQKLFAAYYLDTIIDLIVNLMGSLIGGIISFLRLKK